MEIIMKIIVTGDVCFKAIYNKIDREFSNSVLKEIKPILEGADYTIMNLETPLLKSASCKPITKSGPNIFGIEKNIEFLLSADCDCVTLANNHIGDYGERGVCETLELLSENKISYIGAGRNTEEAYKAKRIEIDGITVSIISVCENEFGGAEDEKSGTAVYDIGLLSKQLLKEKTLSDFVVIIFHGGNEFNPFPSPGAVNRYHLFCDLGADAVVAMHPHCPQGYEYYKGKPIAYSLGNLYFYSTSERKDNSSWYYGYMAELEFNKSKQIKLNAIPYRYNKVCSLISVLTGERKDKFSEYLNQLSKPIKTGEIKALFNSWCMMREGYTNGLSSFDKKYWTGMQNQELYNIKNLLNCESHRELAAQSLKLMCDKKTEEAQKYTEYILKMSEINI